MRTSPTNSLIDHLRLAVLPDGACVGDGELLGRFVERHDEAAFAALVDRHGPMVWGVCRRSLNRHDAEDAFQATFLVLARKASSIRSREAVGNWLYGVAHQTTLHARRTAARRRAKEVQVTTMPDTGAAEPDPWADLHAVLDEELSRLPDIYRAVLVLCDLEGRTRKEVAFRLGVPEGTVGGRVSRARTLLARRLTRRGVALSGGALAAVLTQQGASAGVPNSVVVSTIKAARLVAAGNAATGAVSVTAAALTEGVMKAMLVNKLKAALAVMLVLGVVATGAMLLTDRTAMGQDRKTPAEKSVKPALKVEQEKEAFTAWGKEVGSLQAGLGYRPGEHRTYHPGETVGLVVRVRNVGKEAVKLRYPSHHFIENPPAVADDKGKVVALKGIALPGKPRLLVVTLAPGKEIDLNELNLELRSATENNEDRPWTLCGTGKFQLRYETLDGIVGPGEVSGSGKSDLPPSEKLATGKLELEVRPEPPPAAPEKGVAGPSDQKTSESLTPRKEVDPKAVGIVERAIKSHGGADALNKYAGGWSRATTRTTAAGSDALVTSETTFQYPDKYRTATGVVLQSGVKQLPNGIEIKGGPVGLQSSEVVQVFDGRTAKKTLNGAATELDEQEKAQLRAGVVLLNIQRLTPLLDAGRYTLRAGPDVGGEQVVEVTPNSPQGSSPPFNFYLGLFLGGVAEAVDVTAKEVAGIRLFFDKKSGLLVKTSRRAIDPSAGGAKEATIDTLFSEYKDVGGVKVPMKQVTHVNGKVLATTTVTGSRMLEVVDPKTFNVE